MFGFVDEHTTGAGRTETKRTRLLSLVVDGERVEVKEVEGTSLLIHGRRYAIANRYDHPPRLDQEWSREDFNAFLKDPRALPPTALYHGLRQAVHRHLDLFDRGAEVLVTLYPLITFVFPAFSAVPFLLFLGPKETGKSQALDLLSRLCRASHKSRATAAAVGDLVESQRATLLLDQADGLGPDLLDLLTDSYRAGTRRTVVNPDKRGQPHTFRTFGPKVFAAHGNFDADLLDRCVQIPMSPATRRVEPILAGDRRLDGLRYLLYRFVAVNYPSLFRVPAMAESKAMSEKLSLQNRAWEIFSPFQAIMEWLDVPGEDQERALEYFRRSLHSTSAELPADREAVLQVLARIDDEVPEGESLSVKSPELLDQIRHELDHDTVEVNAASVGTILLDLGLVREKSRPWVEGKRVTEWLIDRDQLRITLRRWRLLQEDEEHEASAPSTPGASR